METIGTLLRASAAGLAALLLAGAAAGTLEDGGWPPPLDPVLQAAWERGLELEQREAFSESSEQYRLLARALPDSAAIRWRISRNYWRLGERLPTDDKPGRLSVFRTSEHWADEALRVDPECGECVMWKVASMGRVATTSGVVQSAARASEIARLIDYGIALRPGHADNPRNSTLANLYYAGAAFYRVVPEWFWLELVIGVRGDRERALAYIDQAIAITGDRIDYQVERGAVLLCIGHDDDDPRSLTEGRQVLAEAVKLADFQTTDAHDRAHADVLLAHPERACSYSRDGWIDLSEARRP
jgi:tetratricopeptide (TPR) repeat protein